MTDTRVKVYGFLLHTSLLQTATETRQHVAQKSLQGLKSHYVKLWRWILDYNRNSKMLRWQAMRRLPTKAHTRNGASQKGRCLWQTAKLGELNQSSPRLGVSPDGFWSCFGPVFSMSIFLPFGMEMYILWGADKMPWVKEVLWKCVLLKWSVMSKTPMSQLHRSCKPSPAQSQRYGKVLLWVWVWILIVCTEDVHHSFPPGYIWSEHCSPTEIS